MDCQKCKSDRVATINAKCSDCCSVQYKDYDSDGYVPSEFGIGRGDYIELDICLECGTLQNLTFPMPEPEEFIADCKERRGDFETDEDDPWLSEE
jgi:hypothetical protein